MNEGCKKLQQQGYVVLEEWMTGPSLWELKELLKVFHHSWCEENQPFYQTRAINSAYITADKHLSPEKRQTLFEFLGGKAVTQLAENFVGQDFMFMGTQLFFNPFCKEQKNYWHRDPQYHLNLEQQKAALKGFEPLHFRLALADEPGIEVIPASHKNWDTELQLNTRLEQNGAKASDDLPQGKVVPLKAGDLLVFSANMIHRGLYGLDRFAFDMLFCPPLAELASFVPDNCLPDEEAMQYMQDPRGFRKTLELKQLNHQ